MQSYKTYSIWNNFFKASDVIIEQDEWNEEYEGMNISCETFNFKSRLAKKTPKKPGYFFAIWKKDGRNKNIPLNENDLGDYLVVNILDDNLEGQFVFPVGVLTEKGIIQSEKSKGKMAFRIYPPWVKDLNKTAIVTQTWQKEYFFDMNEYHFNSK